jgi:hypothetical protein
MQDVILAVVAYLKADAGVIALFADPVAGPRVFGAELPQSEAAAMPRKAIVVKRVSGSGGLGGNLELEAGYLDLVSYGMTPAEAAQVRGVVRTALRNCNRIVSAQTLLHSFEPSSAPVQDRDHNTNWPFVVEPWQFLASESQAA